MADINRTALLVILGSCIFLVYILLTVYTPRRSCIESFQTAITPQQKEQLQELKEFASMNLEKVKEQSEAQKALNKKIAKNDLQFCDEFLIKRLLLSDQWQKTQEDIYLIQLGALLDTLHARNKEKSRVTVC
jgi:hypothetical protein